MQTKERLRKGAYTAVGAPIAGYKIARQQVSKLADTVDETRRMIKTDMVKEFDQWVAEGEVVVEKMLDWLRSTGIDSDIRSFRRTATEQLRTGMAEVSERIDDALDVVEPEIDLVQIRGIGPANAEKLMKAGVPGIASFLKSTATEDEISKLSEASDIAEATLTEWRERADLTRVTGIGDAYRRLLNAIGIGTLTHLLNSEAGDVVASISQIDQPGMPTQYPTEADVADWIDEARKLDLSN